MKKFFKCICVGMGTMMFVSLASCGGGTKLEEEDGDKRPAIYVSVFNGG